MGESEWTTILCNTRLIIDKVVSRITGAHAIGAFVLTTVVG